MNKSLYIFILLLLSSNFLDIKPVADWLIMYNGVIGLIVLLLWMVIGVFLYYARAPFYLLTKKNISPFWWIILGILLSMIPAYIYYGQSFGISLRAYRVNISWLMIPMVLSVCPREDEVIRPLTVFSLVYFIVCLLRSYVAPEWFYISEDIKEKMSNLWYDDSQVIWLEGLPLLLIPFYYYCGKVKDFFRVQDVLLVFLYLIIFYTIQNRSTLFIAVIFACYFFITAKGGLKIPIIIFLGIFLVYQTFDVWRALGMETITQLGDSDYNRVKAFSFFINSAKDEPLKLLLGNGFLSSHSTSQMADLMMEGIYNSDLGMIGFWNQFGLIPVIVFITCIIKAFISQVPLYVKFIGLHILSGALTISYFGIPSSILWFTIFYYLMVYHRNVNIEYI